MTNIIKQTVKYVNHLIEKLTGWIFGDARGKHVNEAYYVKNKEAGQKENRRLEKVLNNRNEKELINRFSKIAEHLPGVIYQYRLRPDGTSHFPYASDGIRQIYGVSPEDVLNDATPVFNVLHPDDFDRVRKTILESAKYFTNWHDEYRVNLPSGNTIWVEGNSTPQKLDDGSILWHGYIRDISDRKRTEEDLKKLTKAIEQIADSVLIININGVIEYVNPSFEKLSGYTKDEIIGKSPKDFKFSNEDINIYEELWNTVLTGKTAYGKLANHKKSGEKYFVEKSISPIIINNDGSITHFVSSEKDITDRIRLEIRERNRNHILTYIVEGMPLSKILNFIVSTVEQEDPTSICSILLLDEEGNHLINGAATSLPDFYIQAINGLEIGDGVGSCGAAAYSKKRVIVEDISTHPYWIPFRELAQKANLKSCWSEPIISSDHKLLGTFAIYHHEPKLPNQEDINQLKIAVDFAILAIERKRIEEQLKKYNEHLEELVEERTIAFKESEERFRIFFNSGSDAIFVTELKEGCPGKFIAVNDIACKRLGYSRDELLKMSPLNINSPGVIKQVLEKFKKLNLLENLSSESIHVTKEGKEIPVEINSNIINIEGRNGVLAIARDISLRKQAEKEYQTILHTSIDGFWITNSDGRFLDVNDAYCRMIGYTREELLKIQISDIEIKESPKDVRQHIKTILERGFDRFESRHRCKNGKIIDVEISTQFSDVRGGVFVVFIKDITERKQTEKALRQSEEQLRLLLNSAGEAIYGIDLNGNCTFCNTSTLRFLGYKHPDDLIGKNMHSMIHFNHSDGTHYLGDECRIINAFQNNEGTHINNEVFCRADGTSFPVEYWSYPQQRDGKVIGAVITFFDITERRQAEEEIRKLSRIAEQAPATIVITNLKGDIEYANPSFTKVTGYSLKEAIGQNPRMLKSDVHPKEFYKNIWDIIISGNVWQGELCNKKKNGELYWEYASISPVKNEEGVVTHFVAVKENITERKRLELELQKLYQSVEKSNVSVIFTDKYGTIEYVNPYFLSFTGFSKEEVIGKNPRILKSNYQTEEYYKKLWATINNGDVWQTEVCNRKRNGELYWEQMTISPIKNAEGKITHFVSIQADITELKITQLELLKAKEAADSANRAKSEFLANMSHEIRTPMNAVIGFSDLLLNSTINDEQRSQINSIRSSGKNLLRIINDILDLSKIEADKIEIEPVPVNLTALAKEAGNMFMLKIKEKGIHFSIKSESMIPKALLLDEVRLRQILFNLIGNAVKFTDNGHVTLILDAKSNPEAKENYDLIIQVEDSGIGIPFNQQKMIFQPFNQQTGQNSKKYGGSGLGLTITKKLVEKMRGTIKIVSEAGKGSNFTVVLPNVPTSHVEVKTDEKIFDSSSVIFENAKVLIVDDNVDNRKLIIDLLENSQLTLFEATNGQEAVDIAIQYLPDLIIMDLRMPVMDGYEAIEILKKHENSKHIPIIAISASTKNMLEEIKNNKIFDEYLLKPFDAADLFEKMKKYLKYKIIEKVFDENIDEITFEITKDQKKLFLELVKVLEKEFLPNYSEVIENQMIDQMGNFGKELILFGEKNSFKIISKYGGKIIFYAETFEIEKLIVTLKRFPVLIEKIKSFLKE